jgi:hypothetical protein
VRTLANLVIPLLVSPPAPAPPAPLVGQPLLLGLEDSRVPRPDAPESSEPGRSTKGRRMEFHASSYLLGASTPFLLTYGAKWTVRVLFPAIRESLKLIPETIKDVVSALLSAIKSTAVAVAK